MKTLRTNLALMLIFGLIFLSGCGEDEPPMIEFQTEASELPEGDEITVAFSIPLPAGVTPVFTLSGTAEETTDFTYSLSTSGLVFTAVDDGIYDPDETVIITVTDFSGGATLGVKKVHTITLTETPLTVEFQTVTASRIEGQSIVTAFNLSLPSAVVPAFKITGTAESTVDFTATLGANGFVVSCKKDEKYENAETIIIELTGVTGNAVLGLNKTYTITIVDEDEAAAGGLEIDLTWEATDLSVSDVDVDLLVWLETSPGVYQAQGGLWSAIIGTSPESILIPSNETDGKYALSYVYYSGSSNNLKIKADFRSYKGNINGTSNRSSYTKTYTLVNRNAFTSPYNQPMVVAQTFTKTAGNYTNLTDINVAATGSRTSEVKFILDEESRRIIEAKQASRRPLRD